MLSDLLVTYRLVLSDLLMAYRLVLSDMFVTYRLVLSDLFVTYRLVLSDLFVTYGLVLADLFVRTRGGEFKSQIMTGEALGLQRGTVRIPERCQAPALRVGIAQSL